MKSLAQELKTYSSADLLAECAKLLYGDRWQSALAEDLGVSDRTMRRWAAGTSAIPEDVMGEVLYHMKLRADDLNGTIEALDEFVVTEE